MDGVNNMLLSIRKDPDPFWLIFQTVQKELWFMIDYYCLVIIISVYEENKFAESIASLQVV